MPASPEDIPEKHSYHYTNRFKESLASSNNSYRTRKKYQMNFLVTGVLEKSQTLLTHRKQSVFLIFNNFSWSSANLPPHGEFLSLLTIPVLGTARYYHIAML